MGQAVCEIIRIDRPQLSASGRNAPATDTVEPRVRAWLTTQSAIVEDWLDQLVAANGDERLIGLLHQHAAFLREAADS